MRLTRRALLGLVPWLGALGLVKVAPKPSPVVTDVSVTEWLHQPTTFHVSMRGPAWPRVGDPLTLELGQHGTLTGVVRHVRSTCPRDQQGWADVDGDVIQWRRG